jgi:hypothetical protein
VINVKSVFGNAFVSIRFNIELFSKMTNFKGSCPEKVDEGSQSRSPEKGRRRTGETERMSPSNTINRGQNPPAIFQRNWKVWD